MLMASIAHSTYKKVFEAAKDSLQGGVSSLREAALERFLKKGFPTARAEEWRYTANALNALSKEPYAPVPVDAVEQQASISEGLKDSYRLVFVNGHFYASLSVLPEASGVTVQPLAEALKDEATQSIIAKDSAFNNATFVSLNTAFMNGGVVVKLARGVQLDKPVEVINLVQDGKAAAIHTRNIFVLEQGAQATIFERYEGQGDYWTNAATHIRLERDAVLNHYKIQDESADAYHLSEMETTIADNAEFNSFVLTVGGKVARNEIQGDFTGEHGRCICKGLYLGRDNQQIDNYLPINHATPNNYSEQTYKSVLDGAARGTFYGKVIVPRDAQKTEAHQLNRNLLLSEKAQANSRPELEILADDVQCSHGSTIGQLDENALYYMQARGLSLDAAKALLVRGFIQALVDEVPQEEVRALMSATIERWLEK